MEAAVRILVVGAGLAGLAVARALGRRGMAVEVVERRAAWADEGTGIYLPGNATRALRDLGVGDEVAARAVVIRRQRFCDQRGRVLADIDLPAVWGRVGDCLALRHADLHAVLREGVDVRMGATVETVGADGAVAFGDGSEARYDLVVAADGVHSSVRELVFGVPAMPVRQTGWRFVTAHPGVDAWSVQLGRGSAFLVVPLGDDWVYCYADVTAGAEAPLTALFADFADPVPALVAGARSVHRAAIEEVDLRPWSRGPVLLVGDAAHATSPNMAEGAAMALEDALVLADVLAGQPAIDRATTAYETRRRPRTHWVRAQTHRRDRTRGLHPAVRDLVLRAAGDRIYRANYRPLLDAP